MNWTTIPQRTCEDAVTALEPWLDEHLNMVGRFVRSLIVDGWLHHNYPTPGAAILRDLLGTPAILSRDHETEGYPASNERQVALRIAQCSKILHATNTNPQYVVRVEVLRRDFGVWSLINSHWLERHPVPKRRSARLTIRPELPEGCIIQMVATANLAEG